jgi:putative transposase
VLSGSSGTKSADRDLVLAADADKQRLEVFDVDPHAGVRRIRALAASMPSGSTSSHGQLRAEIDEVFAGGEDLSHALERVAQLGAQLLLQSALEAEVAAFLGRDRYERAVSCEDARVGMRNGYCATTVKTTAGPITLERPKLRGTTERFASRLFGKHVTKTNALEALGDRGVCARLINPGCGGGADRGAGRVGGGVQVDGVADLRGHQGPIRRVEQAPPR